ncbi:nucleoside hydrolase [Stieleria varia]|uniref:Pyrimidine-specific ribonucleoside hydrolase RihB n=1 Tax=Stieleria varia TaxID=2528005 RepID=A0A5C6ATY3_9BACT|nr:nucleoside hydrolase [Stieleria varia]TWU02516.1 Pyrimidine-specific ribonucleoside hydrolase RihB [Stieleria varia]
MTRKIILDCDPGIDDAVALCMALFDPRLEVLAITATAGTVAADQATSNVASIVGALDPPRYPRFGKATESDRVAISDDIHLNGPDGLAGCCLETTDRQHSTPSEKVIAELLRKYPGEITLVCLGPLTNLARLCERDPGVMRMIDKIVISGGAVTSPGNATAVAERNMYFDAASANAVFASPTTKSLMPLDVTDQVSFGLEILEQLPAKYTRAGQLLHKMLSFAFRTAHQKLGRELIPFHDATALLSVTEPELFQWQEMAGKVETSGELTRGMTVFDQRLRPQWQRNMEVACGVDEVTAKAAIVRALRYAGQES